MGDNILLYQVSQENTKVKPHQCRIDADTQSTTAWDSGEKHGKGETADCRQGRVPKENDLRKR